MTNTADSRLEYCLDALQHLFMWTLGFAADPGPLSSINGPILTRYELEAIGIPIKPMLWRMAGEPVAADIPDREIAYYGRTIRRCAFSNGGERPVHIVPGDSVPPGDADHMELTPALECMPFSDINSAIERLARDRGIPPEELHFKYRGVRISDADMLYRMARIRPEAIADIADALTEWRDRAATRLSKARADAGEHYTIPVPAWVRGAWLPRKLL